MKESCKGIFIVLVCVVIVSATACLAHSAEEYRFERMWPTVQQPWNFATPCGVAADSSGLIYVLDTTNFQVQKLTSEGHFVDRWGCEGTGNGEFGSSPYSPFGPQAIAVSKDGFVYVADTCSSRVQKFTAGGQFVTAWGRQGSGTGEFGGDASQGIFGMLGIAVDENGFVYVADTVNGRVQKFTATGVSVTAWSLPTPGKPSGLAVDHNGFVYVGDPYSGCVRKFTADGQLLITWPKDGTGGSGGIWYPSAIAVNETGEVYVADTLSNSIRKFTSAGEILTNWGTFGSGAGMLQYPCGLAVDPAGFVYVAERLNNRIQKFTSSGGYVATWWSGGEREAEFNLPLGLTATYDDYLLVADMFNHRIQKFTLEGEFVSKWGSQGSGFGQFAAPAGVAVDANGYVYAVDKNNCRVQKFTAGGQFVTAWGSYGTNQGQFFQPYGIALDEDGYVYVVDERNHRVQKFFSEGEFVATWGSQGSGDGQFNLPRFIAADTRGFLYVTDRGNHRIQKFTTSGQFVSSWGTKGDGNGQFYYPNGIAVDESGFVFVGDSRNYRVQKFSSTGQFKAAWGGFGAEPGNFDAPTGITVDSHGAVYVGDCYNNRIQVFSSHAAPPPSQRKEKAIIVAGGGPFAGNNIWDATQLCANFAYRTLTYQGYTKECIWYLSSDMDLDSDGNGIFDDVDGYATDANLQSAIGTWAQDADGLVIYLVDHGGEGTFRMGATELLQATDLDSWLDTIQATIPGTVTVIYDACRSGSFLSRLAPPAGKARILLTSTSLDEEAVFCSQGTISFSFLFWARMFNGDSFYDAFVQAKNAILSTYNQNPLLDGNGNGIGNERADQEAARALRIGNETRTGADLPTIGSITPALTLNGETSASLYAANVIDANGIQRVWALITPPGFSPGSPGTPVTSLPALELASVENNRYEATYTGFGVNGTYKIAVFAVDRTGLISMPRQTTIIQQAGSGLPVLYFPHIASNATWETEIGVINVSASQTIGGSLKAYTDSGQETATAFPLTLAPHGRSEVTVRDAFANAAQIGYLVFEASTQDVRGYAKLLIPGICRVAIPAAREVNTADIPIPHIASNATWQTEIAFLNTTTSAVTASIAFDDGSTKQLTLAPGAHQAFHVEDLFDGQPQSTIHAGVVSNASGVIGMELFSGGNQLEGLLLEDATASTIYYPHIASNTRWWTGIVAQNPSSATCVVTVIPYSSAGAILTPQVFTITPGGKYIGTAADLNLPPETAWVEVQGTRPMAGFELFGTTDGKQLGGYTGVGIQGMQRIFAKIEKNGWTGIALVNTEETTATVVLTAYNDSGNSVATETISVGGHQKKVDLAERLFAGDITSATYITYSATKEVVGFQLNGSNDGTMLDALPGL